MKPLNDEEVQALYGCLLLGAEFSVEDYYAVQKQFAFGSVALFTKYALDWVDSEETKVGVTAEARKFLEQNNQEK